MDNVGVETAVFNVLDNFPPPTIWSESDHAQSSCSVLDDSSAGEDLPSCLADKSPVSLLQELCMKRGLTPHYELTDSDGPVHQKTFTYRVTAGMFVATGKGSSKKRARHAGATIVIAEMLKNSEQSDQIQLLTSAENNDRRFVSASDQSSSAENHVGKLQEITQKKYIAPPTYEFQDNGCPPHQREYSCTVTLLQYSNTACARTKREAKRQAASQLLKQLSCATDLFDNSCTDQESSTAANDHCPATTLPLKLPQKSAYAMLRDGKDDGSIRVSVTQLLKPKQASEQSSDVAYPQILQEIADAHKFSVTFVDVMEPTATGQQQCFVQLSTMPVILCRGVGRTKAEARVIAARDALRCMNHMVVS